MIGTYYFERTYKELKVESYIVEAESLKDAIAIIIENAVDPKVSGTVESELEDFCQVSPKGDKIGESIQTCPHCGRVTS